MDTRLLGQLLSVVLLVCILVLIARLVLDWVQMLARQWRPSGAVAVLCEGIYTVTDPPVRAVRNVVPPIRLGGVALDLSLMILLIAVYVLQAIVNRTLL